MGLSIKQKIFEQQREQSLLSLINFQINKTRHKVSQQKAAVFFRFICYKVNRGGRSSAGKLSVVLIIFPVFRTINADKTLLKFIVRYVACHVK